MAAGPELAGAIVEARMGSAARWAGEAPRLGALGWCELAQDWDNERGAWRCSSAPSWLGIGIGVH